MNDPFNMQKMQVRENNSKIKMPFLLGFIIYLGSYFDLLDQRNLDFLLIAYKNT